MSILIRGMEIPKVCYECRMYEAYIYYCAAAEREINIPSSDEGRCSFCPLVSIPPHGRLIDEQWLKNAMITTLESLKKNPKMDMQEMHLIAAFNTLRAMVEDAPTIIPANEG